MISWSNPILFIVLFSPFFAHNHITPQAGFVSTSISPPAGGSISTLTSLSTGMRLSEDSGALRKPQKHPFTNSMACENRISGRDLEVKILRYLKNECKYNTEMSTYYKMLKNIFDLMNDLLNEYSCSL